MRPGNRPRASDPKAARMHLIYPILCSSSVTAMTAVRAAESMVPVPIWMETVAIVVASITGALAARERKLDLVGAICLAVLVSLGGGLLRDVILQVGNVYILNQPLALPVSVITAALTFVFPSPFLKQDRVIALLDIFSVGLYAATGADKALVYGFEPMVCVMMGFFTAVGGGMLRDVCLGETPRIFQRSTFYAVAAIGGSVSYTLLTGIGYSHIVALVACVAVTIALRLLSLHYNIQSPTDEDIARAAHKVKNRASALRSAESLERRRGRIQADISRRQREEIRRAWRGRYRRR